MADSKSVDLFLRVTTTLIGGDVLGKLSSGFSGLQKQVGLVHGAMSKIVGTAAAITIGFKGISAATDWVKKGVEGARQTRTAQESLANTLRRVPGLAKEGEVGIALYNEKLDKLAEATQTVGLRMKGDMLAAFQILIRGGMSPDRVEKMSASLEGLSIRLGTTAADSAAELDKFILRGKRMSVEMQQALGLTNEQIAAYGKMSQQERGAKLMEHIATNTNLATASIVRQLTEQGKLEKQQMDQLVMAEKIGDPLIDLQNAWTKAMSTMQSALTPLVELLSKELKIAVDAIAKWLAAPDTVKGMQDFGDATVRAFEWVKDNWSSVSAGLTAIGTAMGALTVVGIITNPLLLAIATVGALGTAVGLLHANWATIGPIVDTALGPLKNLWGLIEPSLKEAGTKLVQFFKGEITWDQCWTGIVESVSKIKWDEIGNVLVKGFTDAFTKMGDALQKIDWGAIMRGVGAAIIDALVLTFTIATELPQRLGQAIGDLLLKTDWIAVFKTIDQAITSALQNLFVGAWNKILETFPALMAIPGISKMEVPAAPTPVTPPGVPMMVEGWEVSAGVSGALEAVEKMPPAMTEVSSEMQNVAGEAEGVKTEIGGWPSGVASATSSMGAFRAELVNAVSDAARLQESLSRLSVTTPPRGGGIAGLPGGAFQHGGIAEVPSIVGEAGPEAVLPLREPATWGGILKSMMSFRGASKALQDIFTGGLGGKTMMSAPGPSTALDFGKVLEVGRTGLGPKAGGAINVQVSPNITINGIAEAESIGREVQRAMQDPVDRMLEQLAKARDEERRLAYV